MIPEGAIPEGKEGPSLRRMRGRSLKGSLGDEGAIP